MKPGALRPCCTRYAYHACAFVLVVAVVAPVGWWSVVAEPCAGTGVSFESGEGPVFFVKYVQTSTRIHTIFTSDVCCVAIPVQGTGCNLVRLGSCNFELPTAGEACKQACNRPLTYFAIPQCPSDASKTKVNTRRSRRGGSEYFIPSSRALHSSRPCLQTTQLRRFISLHPTVSWI